MEHKTWGIPATTKPPSSSSQHKPPLLAFLRKPEDNHNWRLGLGVHLQPLPDHQGGTNDQPKVDYLLQKLRGSLPTNKRGETGARNQIRGVGSGVRGRESQSKSHSSPFSETKKAKKQDPPNSSTDRPPPPFLSQVSVRIRVYPTGERMMDTHTQKKKNQIRRDTWRFRI